MQAYVQCASGKPLGCGGGRAAQGSVRGEQRIGRDEGFLGGAMICKKGGKKGKKLSLSVFTHSKMEG